MANLDDSKISRRAVLGGAVGIPVAGILPAGAAPAAGILPVGAAPAAPTALDRRAVEAVASRLDRSLIALRRDLHRHPEPAGGERRTARVVARRLRAAGIDVITDVGGHGVVALVSGSRPGRTIAYRADMDAVPPSDQIQGGTQTAHLCGHDIHTAVGVGVAEVLARLRHRLAGSVLFLFQPAEEALTGAAAMLGAGVFDRVRPAEIHAVHCGPFPVGQFVVTPGFGLPGLDQGTVGLTGAHAAEQARQLAEEINALGTVSPPAGPADLERLVEEFQTPDGPLAEFVYMRARAVGPEVQLSYRCWPENRYRDIRDDIRRLAAPVVGATVSFPADPFPAMVCPEPEGYALQRYLRRTAGRDRVGRMHAAIPFNGEDFALFLQQAPGTFTFLGVRSPDGSIESSYPHFGTFEPDERAIGHGVRAMAGWLAARTRA